MMKRLILSVFALLAACATPGYAGCEPGGIGMAGSWKPVPYAGPTREYEVLFYPDGGAPRMVLGQATDLDVIRGKSSRDDGVFTTRRTVRQGDVISLTTLVLSAVDVCTDANGLVRISPRSE